MTNTGNVTLNPVAISDPKVGTVSCPVTNLPPGATTTCTKSYAMTQADVDSGHVANTAIATGTPPSGLDSPAATDSTDTSILATPQITLDKRAGTPSSNAAGSTVDYTFIVTNTGNVTLNAVSVSDPAIGAVVCPVTVLAPTASTTCARTYTLSQVDVDAGRVTNTATAAGTPPSGPTVTARDSVDTLIARDTSITLDKQSAGVSDPDSNGPDAGDVIDYSFLIGNSGNTTLTQVTVTDPLVGRVTCPVTTLLPAGSVSCSKAYTLTQDDVDSGHVENTATATATPPTGLTAPAATDSTDTPLTAGPAITLDKSASAAPNAAGSTIDYTFTITNSGNVTLTDVGVSDPNIGEVTCPVATLAPAASTICSAAYTLTQADVDAGLVNNTATASGTPPSGADVSATDSVTTLVPRSPGLTLDKSAGTPSGATVGSTIDFEFLVTNRGNVTLSETAVTDEKLGSLGCAPVTLAPGASTSCTASHTLTQDDVDSGHFANVASATAAPPTGLEAPTATDETDSPIEPTPVITLDKTAGTPGGTEAGATIDYTFVVANAGNVTLSSVGVSDPQIGPVACPEASLAPGTSMTCEDATYTLTQADLNAGVVINEATASASPPSGEPVQAIDSTSTELPATPALTLDKRAGSPTGNVAGSTIDYTLVATNTGNVTLDPVAISDSVVTLACPETADSALDPGETLECTATYALTQADVDAGHVANVATASGTPPTGSLVTASDATDTEIAAEPGIDLDVTAGTPSGDSAGSALPYNFVVTNTGNVTVDRVTVDAPPMGEVSCPASSLAPAEATNCAASYILTQADIDSGEVTADASASSSPPTGDPVSATDNLTTELVQSPAIELDKSAASPSGSTAESTIDYTFVVTNNGNVTLDDVAVSDPTVESVDCRQSVLIPGARTICNATYIVTDGDVGAGHVENVATATGTPPAGLEPPVATDMTDSTIAYGPTMSLDLQAAAPDIPRAGSNIDYTYTLTNTGDFALSPITLEDTSFGPDVCSIGPLGPLDNTTCSKSYTLSQAEVDAGFVANDAIATGQQLDGISVVATDFTVTRLDANPVVTVDKEAAAHGADTAGDTIDYTFVVTNAGNVTLDAILVTDPMVGSVGCPASTLVPGGSMTCAATYELTQDDVDAGSVQNEASVNANAPNGDGVTATDSTDTPIQADPVIVLDKQAGIPTGNTAGSTLDYSFLVTNAGNVTLDPVAVSDPRVGPVECEVGSLGPDEATTCAATYTLTQGDVDAGHVANLATATGTPPSGSDVSASDETDTPIEGMPALAIDALTGRATGNEVGASIEYELTVSNKGNVTLDALSAADAQVGDFTCPEVTLGPSNSATCAATYTLTQADVDAGWVAVEVEASGVDPAGMEVAESDSTLTLVSPDPAIALEKRGDAPAVVTVGDTISYSLEVTNTGNVTLYSLSVEDPLTLDVSCPQSRLAPAEVTTCSTTYTVSQADIDAGGVVNVASASAVSPTGDMVSREDTTRTELATEPALAIARPVAFAKWVA